MEASVAANKSLVLLELLGGKQNWQQMPMYTLNDDGDD